MSWTGEERRERLAAGAPVPRVRRARRARFLRAALRRRRRRRAAARQERLDDEELLAAADGLPGLLRRGRRAVRRSTTAPTWRWRRAPTASTSARTTCARPARATRGRRRAAHRPLHALRRRRSTRRPASTTSPSGPVHATPTKPGRPAVGLEPVRARGRARPACRGSRSAALDADNVGEVIAAGARRAVVVRAITEAADPGAAARALRDALDAAWRRSALGRRSRKRAGRPAPRAAAGAKASAQLRRSATPTLAAELEPLAPGERPTAVTIAAIVAGALALANLISYLAGVRSTASGRRRAGSSSPRACSSPRRSACGAPRYWAVLGFEVLLGFLLVILALSLVRASNVSASSSCWPSACRPGGCSGSSSARWRGSRCPSAPAPA